MARQTHIVSFEDAKAASSSRRAQTGQRGRARSGAGNREADYFNSWKPASALREAADPDEVERKQSTAGPVFFSAANVRGRRSSGITGQQAMQSGRGSRTRDAYARGNKANDSGTRSARSSRASRGAVLRDVLSGAAGQSRNAGAEPLAEPAQAQAKTSSRAEKRELKRRQRAKERAGRLFDEQTQATADANGSWSDAGEDGAPRAALYEGKMGATHRKSARMQRASTAQPQSAKLNPAGWFSNLRVSRGSIRAATALLCVALAAVFLYVPAQQYYQALRQHDKLAAEYAVLEQRNDALDSQNEALSSNAGMEDAVRQKYGYVVPGDEVAVVTGLSDHATDSSRDYENIEANVLSSTVKAPEEWYTPYLDAFFGVE